MIKTLLTALQGKRGRGFIEAPLPSGTKDISSLIGTPPDILPASASVRSPMVKAKFQSASDACLGFSAAQAYRLSALQKGQDCPDLSGLFPYKLGRASIGLEDTDAGMSYPAMLSAVERFGLCSEAVWPFSLMTINSRPTATALHDGYDRRGLRGYYSIDPDDVVGVRHALYKGFCVVGAWAVDSYFENNTGPILIDKPDSGIVGNHSMPIVDYAADSTFGILNHYDVTWRDNGYCRFTERYTRSSLGFVVFDVADL